MASPNIVWHSSQVTPAQRSALSRTRGTVLWLTGFSGCGKSTVAMALEQQLIAWGHLAYVLDGDNVRHGLCANLGFSPADRQENIRRVGAVAKLMADAGLLVICCFISPYRADRQAVRESLAPGDFIEVFVDAPIEVCRQRDPKGLYVKASAAVAAGKGLGFTGIDAPYEAPETPEVHLHTAEQSLEASVAQLQHYLLSSGRLLPAAGGN
jgi:adenylylsulfate kinase